MVQPLAAGVFYELLMYQDNGVLRNEKITTPATIKYIRQIMPKTGTFVKTVSTKQINATEALANGKLYFKTSYESEKKI